MTAVLTKVSGYLHEVIRCVIITQLLLNRLVVLMLAQSNCLINVIEDKQNIELLGYDGILKTR